jgi:hypothetical protein
VECLFLEPVVVLTLAPELTGLARAFPLIVLAQIRAFRVLVRMPVEFARAIRPYRWVMQRHATTQDATTLFVRCKILSATLLVRRAPAHNLDIARPRQVYVRLAAPISRVRTPIIALIPLRLIMDVNVSTPGVHVKIRPST